MADVKATAFCEDEDYIGLFQYLGPMWIVTCMQILQGLLAERKFIPNPNNYQQELRVAGIYVERMEVAMAAVLHKAARSIDYLKFFEMYKARIEALPEQQQREIREFWASGPKPGLASSQPLKGTGWTTTAVWVLNFEADLEVGGYTLNNGVRIPFPPRGKYWPKRETTAAIARTRDLAGHIQYNVILVPQGKDTTWLRRFLVDQAAESLLSKSGAILIGGTTASVTAGLATVFVPSDVATTLIWRSKCAEGLVYGLTSGF
jgi:hypothetical protein